MKTLLSLFLIFASLAFGQGTQNQVQTGLIDAHGASWRFPESTFAGLPAAAAGNNGWRYTVTDCNSSSCTAGSGTTKADLRSNGTTWDVISGGAGGSSQASVLGGGGSTTLIRAMECASGHVSTSGGTITYPGGTVAAAAAATQEIPIITSLTGDIRYGHVMVGESTQFASGSVTATKVSIGRPGSTTNDELLPQTSMMQSSGNVWFSFDRPQPPILGTSNTYNLMLTIRTTGGNVSALTAGDVYYEVCAYANH